jgi:serine/tyrosine/threonine adenylyltransferase
MPPRPLAELNWQNRFVETFPGDPETRNFTRRVRGVLYSEVRPTPVADPKLLGWSGTFADEIGLARPDDADDRASLELLAGNRVLPSMRPYAARYGGHQFGSWAGQLGDGRAITLGEVDFPGNRVTNPHGTGVATTSPRLEFQLKGPGKTPYSRHADGRAVLRSSLREFLCSEAMHFLGVPTTRALSLVTTGEPVIRDMFYDGRPEAEPGAIVCRVAPTFLRFGNFEILADAGEHDLLKRLADFLVAEFYPDLDLKDPDVYGQLLDEIARRTAVLMAHWQRVGFVHGVMNTDNMSALGLTIDYGPYGWLEPYDPAWTPNTTDAGTGRYRYGNQPGVGFWNVARLAESLFPLVDDEPRLHRSLEIYRDAFGEAHDGMMAAKLGLSSVTSADDKRLIDDMADLLRATETDYTIFFRQLSDWPAKAMFSRDPRGSAGSTFLAQIAPAFYVEPGLGLNDRWAEWAARYAARAAAEPASDAERAATMKRANPKYVLRNYLAQLAINAATAGDASVMERLLRVLERPYDEQPAEQDLYARRPDWARNAPGCSALSCSS